MATTSNTPRSAVVTPTATQGEKRDVSTELRYLFNRKTHTLSMVGKGENDGKKIPTPMIKMRKITSLRAEWFTTTPLADSFSVTGWTAGTSTLAVSDAADLKQYDTIINSRTNAVGRVDSISSNNVVITDIGGAFSAAAGDTVILLATAYPSGSSAPKYNLTGEDNNYNVIQEFREPLSINRDARKNPHFYAEGGPLEVMRRQKLYEALRKLEKSFIFGQRPSSTNNNSAGSTLDTAFPSMRGAYQWCQNEYPAGGALTYETFMADAMDEVSDTAQDGDDWIAYCSGITKSRMSLFASDAYRVDGMEDKFGYTYERFQTSRGIVRVIPHEGFESGAYKNQIFIFRPSELKYCYYEGSDIQLSEDIQDNDAHVKTDEIFGYVTLEATDAGRSMLIIKDAF